MTGSDELVRFTMSLPRDDYAALGELAGLLSVSRASLVRDLLESARPVWAVLLDAARATASAPAKQREAFVRLAEELAARTAEGQALLDGFAADVEHYGEADDGPPASNTGVTTP
jgi:hypothetical protein